MRFSIGNLALILCLLATSPATAAEVVRLGVLAFRGHDNALFRWSPTAAYLSRAIEGHRFVVVPLSLEDMGPAVARHEVDFVLTNTGNYVDLEARHGISRIATMLSPKEVEAGSVFGAVIFTRADRDDIRTLADLDGKSFMAVKRQGFGGFQMAWRELKAAGLDPFSDFSELRFGGFPQDKVVYAVLNGEVDAGTLRTDTLESMAAEDWIDLNDLKVLAPRTHPGFPFLVSTRLYPEWPFAKARHTSSALARRTALALLSLPEDSVIVRAGGYGGWTVPLDYQPVHEMFKELRIGPYAEPGPITIGDIVGQYGHWLLALLLVLGVTVGWATRVEHLVKRRTRELSEAQAVARQRQTELAHAARLHAMGEMASSIAHELNQPLAAITNYANGAARRLDPGDARDEKLRGAMERISTQADRAAGIIRRIRGFVRKEEPVHRPVDVNDLIRDVAAFVGFEAERQGVTLTLTLDESLPRALGDRIQIEQVVLNLSRNAIEAMAPGGGRLEILGMAGAAGEVVVEVRDDGPGLSAAGGAEKVFAPFETTKPRGLGLGLSISRSIVESHGGSLKGEERPQGGAVFRFTLPLAEETET